VTAKSETRLDENGMAFHNRLPNPEISFCIQRAVIYV